MPTTFDELQTLLQSYDSGFEEKPKHRFTPISELQSLLRVHDGVEPLPAPTPIPQYEQPPPEPLGWREYIGEAVQAIPRGAASAAISGGMGLNRKIGTLLEGGPLDGDVVNFLRMQNEVMGNMAQDAIQKALPVTPGFEDSWTRKGFEGLGSTVPAVVAGVAAGPTGLGVFGASQAYESTFREVMELTNGDREAAEKYASFSAGVTGVTEPFLGAVPQAFKIFTRLDKITGKWIGKQALKSAGQEALQEGIQEIPPEVARQAYLEDRKFIDSLAAVGESAVLGGTIGGLFGTVAGGIKAIVARGDAKLLESYEQRVEAGQSDPTPSQAEFEAVGDPGGTRTVRKGKVEKLIVNPPEVFPARRVLGETNVKEVETSQVLENDPAQEGQAVQAQAPQGEVNAVLADRQLTDNPTQPPTSAPQPVDQVPVTPAGRAGGVPVQRIAAEAKAAQEVVKQKRSGLNPVRKAEKELDGIAREHGEMVLPENAPQDASPEQSSYTFKDTPEGRSLVKEIRDQLPPGIKWTSKVRVVSKDRDFASWSRANGADVASEIGTQAMADSVKRGASNVGKARYHTIANNVLNTPEAFPVGSAAWYSARKWQLAEQSKGDKDAIKTIGNEPPDFVKVEQLKEGDKLKIAGEEYVVGKINEESDTVTLEDGIAIEARLGQPIAVDKGSYRAAGARGGQPPTQAGIFGQPIFDSTTGSQRDLPLAARQESNLPDVSGQFPLATPKEAGGVVSEPGQGVVGQNLGPNMVSAEVIDKIAKTGVSIGRAVRRAFRPRGGLPQTAFDLKTKYEAELDAAHQRIRWANNNLKAAIKKDFGKGALTIQGEKMITDAFEDEGVRAGLPPETRAAVQAARDLTDSYHRRIREVVPMGEKMEAAFDAKEGIYMRRTYAAHRDPEWMDKVPQHVRDEFKQQLIDEHPDFNNNQLDHLINTMLYDASQASNPLVHFSTGKLGSKDLSGLMRRKNLSEAFRKLLGEEKDPMTNFVRTTMYQSRLIANQQFLNDVRDAGTAGGWLFKLGDPNADPKAMAEIAPPIDKTMNPLNGYRTYPEVAEAFNRHFNPKDSSLPMQWYYRSLLLSKASKTLLSHVSQIRNLISNPKMLIANGHWKLWKVKDPLRAVLADFGWIKNPPSREYLLRLQELEVWNQSATSQELNLIARGAFGKSIEESFDPNTQLLFKAKGVAGKIWQAGDNIFRVYFFEAEKARYRSALPDATDTEIEQMAATSTKRHMPTGSQIVPAVRAAQRLPFVETFIGFHAEMIRTKFNLIKTIKKELSDQNPKMKAIGAQRLAGLLASMAVLPAIKHGIYALFGINGDNEDDVAGLLHDYQENNSIILLGNPKDGKISYIDTAFTDPDSVLVTPVIGALRADDWEDAFWRSTKQAFGTFFGENIITETVIDLIRGKDKDGFKVWDKHDTAKDIARDVALRIGKAYVPGSAVSLDRLRKAEDGTIDQSGRSYDPKTERIGQFGFRAQELDVRQRINQKAGRFQRETTDAADGYRKLLTRRGTVDNSEILAARQQAEVSRKELFDDMRLDVQRAIRLGVSIEDVKAAMQAGGVSKETSKDLLDGTYEPYEPSKQLEKKFKKKIEAVPKPGSATIEDYKKRAALKP